MLVVVFDTNVLLSAFHSPRGNPARCIAMTKAGFVRSVTCQEILNELKEKLLAKLLYDDPHAQDAVAVVRGFSTLATISGTMKVVDSDPDDDKIIECAVQGAATHVVTGDQRHLLKIIEYQGIRIISPADLVALVLAEPEPD